MELKDVYTYWHNAKRGRNGCSQGNTMMEKKYGAPVIKLTHYCDDSWFWTTTKQGCSAGITVFPCIRKNPVTFAE